MIKILSVISDACEPFGGSFLPLPPLRKRIAAKAPASNLEPPRTLNDVADCLPVICPGDWSLWVVTMHSGNAWSRWRERLADRYALQRTGKSQAFASAMTRLANQNLAALDPEPWVEFLLYSHPALRKRIEMAEGWKA